METPKGNKRSAENDSVTIDKFLNSKRLRRTLMNEEVEYNEGEEDTVEYHEYGDDEEMVIVVVQNEEENAMDNDYQQVVDDHNIEEEVAYDFINEHENSVSFITERVNSEQPTPSSEAQKEQNFSGKLYPKKIIGTKCLTIKPKKELCRLCLSKQKNMCSLFETSLKFIKSSLKEVIETCIGIKVLRDDATDLICRACISRLESIWAFREQCEQSDRMVKQMKLEKVQQRIADDGNQNLNISNNEPSLPSYGDPIDDFRVSLSKFSCIDCKKRFHTEIALAAHVTNDHAHLKPFTHNTSYLVNCSICGSRVIKKVLHDHYLQHKIAGEDASAYQDDDEEGDEEFIDGDTYYEETRQHNVENSGMGNDASLQLEGEPEQITSFPDLGDGETMNAQNITRILNNKQNQHIYKQNECIVTDITGNEFNVDEGQVNKSILGGVDSNNAKVIAVRINEEENYGETTTTDYSQVYLVNQGENLVETSIPQGNNDVENVVSNTEPNQIYVVASDGKSMYVDNQDVVFQIANDQVYQTDGKGDVELVYENTNSSETVLVKEEVIDTSYDQ